MKQKERKIQQWPIEKLKPYANNARTHSDDQVAQVAASITQWGWTMPILSQPDGTIIAGHCRVLAAKSLEMKTVPVIVAEGWTEAQTRAYVLADNKLAENSGWDENLLSVEVTDLSLQKFDMALLGFAPEALNDLIGSPNFPPSSVDDQRRLDQKSPITCPNCQHEFTA